MASQFDAGLKQSIAHLAPHGAPFVLLPLLVLIEGVSLLIRPLTLVVRLIANMAVGHLLCGLVGIQLRTLSRTLSISVLPLLLMFYIIFEFGIRIIQAYIFTLLLTLYSDDSTSHDENDMKGLAR